MIESIDIDNSYATVVHGIRYIWHPTLSNRYQEHDIKC